MANTIQLKRRVSGVAGAPAALKSGELAHNEVDNTVYVGKGDDGSGNATSIVPVAGSGGFLALVGTQTIAGAKTFSFVPKSSQDASGGTDLVRKSQVDGLLSTKAPLASPSFTGSPTAPTAVAGTNSTQIATTAFVNDAIAGFGAGDMAKSTYDTDNDGKVDAAEVADAAPWAGITGKPTSFTPSSHSHSIAQVTGLQTALDAKAPLASPALSGSPTAPTATAGTNTTQIATTAFVAAAIGALIDAAPGAMDTLNELAAALGDDPSFATTVTNALAGKLSAASNLSDLPNKTTARSNLGLGSMATQNANAVAITGGAINGITLDCGTF
ncbi:MAG: head decoration protein [Rhodobacteraceae bacterium]|nr:head decoration protein [Paracoccaceae bacterium]